MNRGPKQADRNSPIDTRKRGSYGNQDHTTFPAERTNPSITSTSKATAPIAATRTVAKGCSSGNSELGASFALPTITKTASVAAPTIIANRVRMKASQPAALIANLLNFSIALSSRGPFATLATAETILFAAAAGWESSARKRISPNAIATGLRQLAIALTDVQLSARCQKFWRATPDPANPYADAPAATITALMTISATSVSSETAISS